MEYMQKKLCKNKTDEKPSWKSIILLLIDTLVENAGGDRRICRSRPRACNTQAPEHLTSPHFVDRKLDFLVKGLRQFGVAIVGVQETKWFGSDVWTADGYTLLHSGRPLPDESELQLKNERGGNLT